LGANVGSWVEQRSRAWRCDNFVGIEIRPALVDIALERTLAYREDANGPRNLHYVAANVNFAVDHIFTELAESNASLRSVSVMHPDPWFKRRHIKRRKFTPELIASVVNALETNGRFLVQSDVRATFDDLCAMMSCTANPSCSSSSSSSSSAREDDAPSANAQQLKLQQDSASSSSSSSSSSSNNNNSNNSNSGGGGGGGSIDTTWVMERDESIAIDDPSDSFFRDAESGACLRTEREQSTLARGEPVYRAAFVKVSVE
jgi:tRNA G46 methylase TrmB